MKRVPHTRHIDKRDIHIDKRDIHIDKRDIHIDKRDIHIERDLHARHTNQQLKMTHKSTKKSQQTGGRVRICCTVIWKETYIWDIQRGKETYIWDIQRGKETYTWDIQRRARICCTVIWKERWNCQIWFLVLEKTSEYMKWEWELEWEWEWGSVAQLYEKRPISFQKKPKGASM